MAQECFLCRRLPCTLPTPPEHSPCAGAPAELLDEAYLKGTLQSLVALCQQATRAQDVPAPQPPTAGTPATGSMVTQGGLRSTALPTTCSVTWDDVSLSEGLSILHVTCGGCIPSRIRSALQIYKGSRVSRDWTDKG